MRWSVCAVALAHTHTRAHAHAHTHTHTHTRTHTHTLFLGKTASVENYFFSAVPIHNIQYNYIHINTHASKN